MTGSSRDRWKEQSGPRGDAYDRRFADLQERGLYVHGEADFVACFEPKSVLDAGCGTGRVAIELARRNIAVVGVDLDPAMLSAARQKAPELDWLQGDLASFDLTERFDVAVMAGNVILFVAEGSERDVVVNVARHLQPTGLLVTGFSLNPGGIDVDTFDTIGQNAGLHRVQQWSTWDRSPYSQRSNYAVLVYRKAEI